MRMCRSCPKRPTILKIKLKLELQHSDHLHILLFFIIALVLPSGVQCQIQSSTSNLNINDHFNGNDHLNLNARPVVGILAAPLNPEESRTNGAEDFFHHTHTNSTHTNNTNQYIAASYVKWLESAGARSIPIPYDAPSALVDELMGQINGILFPGGSAPLPPAAKRIWDDAIDRNERGDFFPIWGTCLGFEYMIMLSHGEDGIHHDGNKDRVLDGGYDAHNISLPLIFPTQTQERTTNGTLSTVSELYASPDQRAILASRNVTMNSHYYGITPSNFLSRPNVTQIFKATSINYDRNRKPFISTIESTIYPFYATQYHPEKNNFEYGTNNKKDVPYQAINHSIEAVRFSIDLALFFVEKTRRNDSGKYTMMDRHPLVYSYEMVSGGEVFEQIFVIPSADHWSENDDDVSNDDDNSTSTNDNDNDDGVNSGSVEENKEEDPEDENDGDAEYEYERSYLRKQTISIKTK